MTTESTRSTASTIDQPLEAPHVYVRTIVETQAVPDDFDARLRRPQHGQRVAVPLERDDGTREVFDGYRIRHDDSRGPFLGPHRYQSTLDAAACTGLATAQTVTAAIADVPFGGAAGGVAVDPATLSTDERDRLALAYAEQIAGIGPDYDVLSPGVGTDGRTVARLAEAVADRVHGPHRATVVGKPPAVDGCRGLGRAAGHGIALTVEQALEEVVGRSLPDATVAVYGTDVDGTTAARLLDSWGATVVAMGSDCAGLERDGGLDTGAVVDRLDRPRAITAYDGATMTGRENVLERDVDVLLVATAGGLTADVARSVDASLVVEGAYGGVMPGAQRVLDEREIVVVPDVLAGVGGTVAGHLEWVQSAGRDHWSEARVRNELGYALVDAWDDVRTTRERDDLTWREAAYALGVSRVADAHEVVR